MTSFPSPASSCAGRTTAGCISRILRRILCFSNLPLRSFHNFNKDEETIVESCSSTPGLVARLMGLESLPPIIHKSTSPPQRIILPAYRELQDDNFFILSFERRKSSKNSNTNFSDKSQKQRRKRRRRERDMVFSQGVLEFEIRPRIRAKKANPPVELGYEAEGDSENSSPNSVLEFVGFPADQEPASSGEISRLTNSKLRRPLSDDLENCGNSREKNVINNVQNYGEIWEEMGELAGMEMIKSSWLGEEMSKNGNCLMEMGRDLELCILDQLLNEMLTNLQIF
ncbi:hypothetical protein ACS0TY_014865 [Phlomoides rotata]